MPIHATSFHTPTLYLSPDALLTAPFAVNLSGLPSGAVVELRAQAADANGAVWQSWAVFHADSSGQINVAQSAPSSGSYSGVDASGLLWSMRPAADLNPAAFQYPPGGYTVQVEARIDGQTVVTGETQRWSAAPGLREQTVREGGLYGILYRPPAGVACRGAALVLGGSEGGVYPGRARLLASEGFLTLGLAYFGAPGLPEALVNIPLEYFQQALSFLRAQPEVQGRRVGVTGASKGAEAALLLGATSPADVGAVVAMAPSGLVFEGIDRTGTFPADQPMSSWSLDGVPLPYLPYRTDWEVLFAGPRPVSMTPAHEEALHRADAAVREAATIPTERIQGQVLLVSGQDDQVWNAYELSLVAQQRREALGLPIKHLTHADAGHSLSFPGLPTFFKDPWGRMGGTPAANAFLQAQAWQAALDTLASVWQKE